MIRWRSQPLPAIFIILAAACFSLGVFCERVVGAHVVMLAQRLLLLGAGMFAVGGLALIVRAVRTTWHISRLHELSNTAFPDTIRLRVHQIGFDSRQLVLVDLPEPQAFCYGFLRPRICLSTGLIDLLSPAQLRAVLLHEDHHRRHFHPLRILLLDALAAAFFFLPVVGDWCKLLRIKLELDADQYAVEQAGTPALAGALHRLLSHPTEPIQGAVVGLSVNETRVARLLGDRDPSPSISGRSLIISTISLLVLCMVVV